MDSPETSAAESSDVILSSREEKPSACPKRQQEIAMLVQVLLYRPFDKAVVKHHRIGHQSAFGFHVAVLCRLVTLSALVYNAVQSSVLIVDTFDLVNKSQNSDVEPPKTFDIIYFVMLTVLLLSAFLAIFGIIFYRAYLTVPFVLCGLSTFCLLSGLLNYSLFQPPERLYAVFTTLFPDHRLNALFDIVMVGLATYITLCNIREQVIYDLPPVRLSDTQRWREKLHSQHSSVAR